MYLEASVTIKIIVDSINQIIVRIRLTWCLSSKQSAYNAQATGDMDSVPESGRSPGGGHGNPLQYSCLENPRGLRSLVGYSPWGHKESDMT